MKLHLCLLCLLATVSYPYREQVVDFTCPVFKSSDVGYAIFALGDSDVDTDAAVANAGEGLTICTANGSIQSLLVDRTFGSASLVEMALASVTTGLCSGQCNAVVDEVGQFDRGFANTDACEGMSYVSTGIGSPSSGGDVGGFTYRPVCE